MEPADAVLRFLDGLGRRSEADFYLSLFRAEPKERFAAISVDANALWEKKVAEEAREEDGALHLVSCGRAFPGHEIAIFDPVLMARVSAG